MKKKIDISGVDPILFVGLNDQNIIQRFINYEWTETVDVILN